MIRILQHRHKCIGCNACVEVDKNRWRISKKDGKSTLIDSQEKKGWFTTIVTDEEEDKIKAAIQHCPVKIIQYVIL